MTHTLKPKPKPKPEHEAIKVICTDGVELSGQLHRPEGAVKAVVLINPGTGTKTRYYYPFAEYLRQQGFLVCTWNYRGIDQSRSERFKHSLKDCHYRFTDIGKLDIPAVITYLKDQFPDLPLLCVAHSAGAQQIGSVHNNNLLDGLLAVACSVGYPPFMPIDYRLQSNFFFRFFVPLSITLTGYVAAARVGLMEDLPAHVALEWKRWCQRPDYFFDSRFYGRSDRKGGVEKGNYQSLPFPVRVFTASDDEISTYQAVTRFWGHCQSEVEPIKFSWYTPDSLGVKKIKHFGYFRERFRESIWKDMSLALLSFLG